MTALPASPDTADTGLSDAVRESLDAAGRLGTVLGQGALALAKQLEAGDASGSAYAALHREMRATVADALKGVGAPESAVQKHRDELAARRAKHA